MRRNEDAGAPGDLLWVALKANPPSPLFFKGGNSTANVGGGRQTLEAQKLEDRQAQKQKRAP